MAVQEQMDAEKVRKEVRKHYGQMAAQAGEGEPSSCCSPAADTEAGSSCCSPLTDTTRLNYDIPEVGDLPEQVRALSAGCGDPVTLAELKAGQVVLDLGSGGGIDCFLAAQKVGTTGHVIGVDMTVEMLTQARANQAKMGMDNVEFRLGEIEHLPVADNSVDVILSNCVINLSPDKPQVFREAYRVLNSGGRLAVSDIVADGPLPLVLQQDLTAWAGCLAGAMDQQDYISELERAGFVDVVITDRQATLEATAEFLAAGGIVLQEPGPDGQPKPMVNIGGEWKVLELGDRRPPFSARITARKP
jgi:arsenite methyltransferase